MDEENEATEATEATEAKIRKPRKTTQRTPEEKAARLRATIDKRYPGLFKDLGKIPDRELGDRHGLTGARIGQYRATFGIPVCPDSLPAPAELDPGIRNLAFQTMAQAMMDREGCDLAKVAKGLDVELYRVATWFEGRNGRQPSWEILSDLAALAGFEIRIRGPRLKVVACKPSGAGVGWDREKNF